jgi:hypothetical protein
MVGTGYSIGDLPPRLSPVCSEEELGKDSQERRSGHQCSIWRLQRPSGAHPVGCEAGTRHDRFLDGANIFVIGSTRIEQERSF